jgi:hypothetical protein
MSPRTRWKETTMADYETREPVRTPEDRGNITGYAAVKYGFIFLIVVAILWFLAAYLIPAITS